MQRSQATRGRSRVVSAPVGGGHSGSNSSSERSVQVESSIASTSASLRTRGATQGIIRKLPPGSKKRIHVHKKVFIEDEARSTIGAIFRANMDFPFVVWSSWKKYPERKEMLWQKFLGYFDFESLEQEAAGRVAFFHHISTNYTKWMEGARKFAISKVGEDAHPELWRNHPPEWIRNDIWQKMVDVWASTKWQEKSRCAKTNRSVNDEPSHTGGSVPHAVIGVELKEKMPDISDAKLNLEVYELTHKLKHDSNGQPLEEQDRPYVSKKAKAIRDAYAVRFDEISSQEPSSSLIDYDAAELWRQTPGVRDKKGRIRGTRETARDARASMHISLDQLPSSKNWKDEIAKIVQLEVQKMKEIEIAKLVEIEVEKRMKEKNMQQVEVSATDATEDGNDETFDELGG
ncbi:hypothetical protein RJ639_001104 [Escallonia herrerae]|uniref:Transposase n=1 Tax=Escallonia herrerae TaxID=1293975 RepID=A0AA88XA03_9ASTE|nr:hypothetical protein RJ639_025278 [Escallonia herrerae]KAK3042831.1 hypothetical protein RJ639_001104 [Escallonia herrerae]